MKAPINELTRGSRFYSKLNPNYTVYIISTGPQLRRTEIKNVESVSILCHYPEIGSAYNFCIIKIYAPPDGVILLKNEKCFRSVNIEQLRPLTAEIYYNILGKCDCLRNMAVDLVLCLSLVSRNCVTLFTFAADRTWGRSTARRNHFEDPLQLLKD